MKERWYVTVRCREEHAIGEFGNREFGPFVRQVHYAQVFRALHSLGWEGNRVISWQSKPHV